MWTTIGLSTGWAFRVHADLRTAKLANVLTAPNGDPVPRVLTSAFAAQLGYSPTRIRTELRRGRWDSPCRGVYLTRGDLPSRGDWLRIGLSLAVDGVVSGWDAVRAYGLGAPRPPHDDVLLLAPEGRRNRTVGHVHIRPSPRALISRQIRHPGAGTIQIADPARAVADTALVLATLAPTRALVTSAVQRGLCSVDDLMHAYAAGPRNHSGQLRRALTDVAAGAASLPEAELAEILRAAELPEFELNVPVIDASGRHIATIDVLWRRLRAGLEVDSQAHHFLELDWRATMRRHNSLTAAGLALTHYPPLDIRDRRSFVVAEVEHWLRDRAYELGVAYPPGGVDPQIGRPFQLP